jgi:hypothetical protein
MVDYDLEAEFSVTALEICQECLRRQVQLQETSETNSSQYVSIKEWQNFQQFVQVEWVDRMMENGAEAEAEADTGGQLRSLLPEVVRLLKLLQIDRQFWQAARQVEKQAARQQQFMLHLTQLGQLLQVFETRLMEEAESRSS